MLLGPFLFLCSSWAQLVISNHVYCLYVRLHSLHFCPALSSQYHSKYFIIILSTLIMEWKKLDDHVIFSSFAKI
jgi:hypothetical protein